MKTRICRHIKTNGQRCKSPRLTNRDLCYFHARSYERQEHMVQYHSPISAYGPTIQPIEIDLPILEDAESIQVSISLIVSALARNRIDAKRAAVVMYGLQLASTNARSITTEPFADTVIRNIVQSNFGTDYAAEPDSEALSPTTQIIEPCSPKAALLQSAPLTALPELAALLETEECVSGNTDEEKHG